MNVRKVRAADPGRIQAMDDTDRFERFHRVWAKCVELTGNDPHHLFNVDEVGIQLAEREFHLVTGKKYLNKEIAKVNIHTTVTLCSSPGGGALMPAHFLPGVSEDSGITMALNPTGYQDEQSWIDWLKLFIIWKKERVRSEKPVVLLLDGHFSHLSLESLFLAAKYRIIVVCLPSHTTSVLQPNDRSVNRQFKINLDLDLQSHVAFSLVVESRDIACFVARALKKENMSHAVENSWKQVGLFPLEPLKTIAEVKKFQVQEQDQEKQKKINAIKEAVKERDEKKKKLEEEKEQRKEAGGKIIFGTKQVRVLTSPECMARLKLYKEWVTVKKYNKSLLIESVKRYGFSDQEIRDSKTKPVLLRRVQEFLLAEEEKLTSTFEAELRDVQADIPQHLDDFFIRNPSSTPSVDPSPPPDVEPLIVTSIVDSSPTFGVPSDSLIKEATNWPLSMDLEE
eukprot:CAMPEP_0201501292 /NCGR_PEP_ID=MMETSP0151_2-20130828/83510_1 /ASSEMBLY_ACC=CAM_ASM_000257 /TAXON_ID=200890 /ORGANISM="Paramoeba atlantica, Strain 621/1 / CCAP 1560/9" /LENGTH=451 /DNA_ID=CAMNT_0047894785 /DNA_START=362 /DNA_END=1717 /DNA_ORIENTATION=+